MFQPAITPVLKKLKYVGWGVRDKIKICGGGVAQKNMQGGVSEKKICEWGSAKKIKYGGGVGEKIKMCEGGGPRNFPLHPSQDFKWNSPH